MSRFSCSSENTIVKKKSLEVRYIFVILKLLSEVCIFTHVHVAGNHHCSYGGLCSGRWIIGLCCLRFFWVLPDTDSDNLWENVFGLRCSSIVMCPGSFMDSSWESHVHCWILFYSIVFLVFVYAVSVVIKELRERLGIDDIGRPKRTWREVVEKDCQARKLNKEDAMDRSKWRKLIKDVRWSGWVWVGKCFFWYRPIG